MEGKGKGGREEKRVIDINKECEREKTCKTSCINNL